VNGLVFYIGLGLGFGAACGLRPFLPLLLAGALASSSALGVSFAHGHFHFLRSGWWLVVVAAALALSYAAQLLLGLAPTLDRDERGARVDPLAATLAGFGYGAGALLFAGTLDAHHDAWWPGIVGGILAAALASGAVGAIIARARRRLADRAAREALTVYLDAASLAVAGAVALLHPLGYVVIGLFAWLALAGRGRGRERYAGLRTLGR
jgi:hypothetical protein